MARGDAAGVANCYTIDGEFMAGGSPSIIGRTNIQKTMAEYIGQGFTKYKVLITTVYGSEGIVGVQADYYLSHADGSELDNGKTIQLWNRKMVTGKYSETVSIPIYKVINTFLY